MSEVIGVGINGRFEKLYRDGGFDSLIASDRHRVSWAEARQLLVETIGESTDELRAAEEDPMAFLLHAAHGASAGTLAALLAEVGS